MSLPPEPEPPVAYGPPTTPPLGETHQPGVRVPHPTAPGPASAATVAPETTLLWPRASAFILDLILVAAVVLVIALIGFVTGTRYFAGGLFSLVAVPWAAIVLNTLGVWLSGNTLGQRMARIRVVDAVTGERLGLGRTLLRTAIIVSPLLVLAAVTNLPMLQYINYYSVGPSSYVMVGFAWIAMLIVANVSGRSLHDRAARSTVVRAP